MARDGKQVFVLDTSGELHRLAAADLSPKGEPLEVVPPASAEDRLLVVAGADRVYVVDGRDGKIHSVDAVTWSLEDEVVTLLATEARGLAWMVRAVWSVTRPSMLCCAARSATLKNLAWWVPGSASAWTTRATGVRVDPGAAATAVPGVRDAGGDVGSSGAGSHAVAVLPNRSDLVSNQTVTVDFCVEDVAAILGQ